MPEGALEYHLGTVHWLDAMTPPLEAHLRRLADALHLLLNRNNPEPQVPAAASPATPISAGATNANSVLERSTPEMSRPVMQPPMPAAAPSRTLPERVETAMAAVEGPWDVSFQPNRGAPAKISLDKLSSWAVNADTGVKYFSGTGTYSKTIQAPADWFKTGAQLWLDLGDVKNLAEVSVNGKPLGIVWHAPYKVDITAALKPGANEISIQVVNAWVNRLIGDQQKAASTKYTFTTVKPYNEDSPLQPSGLLGPVRLYSVASK